MTSSEPQSDGGWILLEEFVDDASERMRISPVVPPSVIADPVSQRAAQLTHDMLAAKLEPSEIVRRVLEMVGPSLDSRARDQIRSEIENQIRNYHESLTT